MVHPPFETVGALSLTVKGDAASVARGDFFGEGLCRLLFIPIHRASAPTRPSPGFFPQGPGGEDPDLAVEAEEGFRRLLFRIKPEGDGGPSPCVGRFLLQQADKPAGEPDPPERIR